jgi:DNA-binding transcriptional LysR family regulator
MTFRQLEAFLAVARERSFGRAAHRIHLSQPTLSGHIQELERELGKRLFVRRGREAVLSEAGRVFESHAARVTAAAGDARQAMADLDGLGGGSLVIGASTTPGIYVLPRVVAEFQRRYPGIALTLRIGNSGLIEQGVRADELDLGIVGGHVLGPGERCVAAGLVDELVVIAAPRHPWARRGSVRPRELPAERMLVREPGSATRHVMERALQQAGIVLGPTLELDHTEAIKQYVMAGLGIAFVSGYAVAAEVRARQLTLVGVRGLRIRRHFHVIHAERRTLGASAQAFLAVLDAHATGRARRAGAPAGGGRRRSRRPSDQ